MSVAVFPDSDEEFAKVLFQSSLQGNEELDLPSKSENGAYEFGELTVSSNSIPVLVSAALFQKGDIFLWKLCRLQCVNPPTQKSKKVIIIIILSLNYNDCIHGHRNFQ